MAENVQWIKLKVGMFDGNSFKKIKRAKIGGVSYRDKLTAVWFELMDLAGKSNSNGYLIDNNEIPYHSFEDIATMLDREEKEIELCMQFFISEKMVEIIDDIYCLTNFVKYQNQEGLDKIREQKRLAQSRWRERKKLGLTECNVDEKTSTEPSTTNLPSISISKSNIEYINSLFDKIWDTYPKKASKEQAKKTWHKKLKKLKTEEDILDKAQKIAKMLNQSRTTWVNENRDKQYIPHFSSWLNDNIPD